MITSSQCQYGRAAENLIQQAMQPDTVGARALLETFYYAFNQHDIAVFDQLWAQHDLIQLNNPLGGILRGYEPIANLYQDIFTGAASVWVEFADVVEFHSETMVVFAGRETGEFTRGGHVVPLAIRTSRVVQWMGAGLGWKQTHHHGSIDDAPRLAEYQRAVRGTAG